MDLLRAWRLIVLYRWMLILLFVSAAIAAVGVTYALDPQYESTALLLLRPYEKLRLEPNKSGKEILDYPVSQLGPIDAPSRTYIEVIKSPALAERVVLTLELHKKRRLPAETYLKELWYRFKEWTRDRATDAWALLRYGAIRDADPLVGTVQRLQRNLALKTTKDTYVFEITFISNDPQEAAAVANQSADLFIEFMLGGDRKESTSVREFLEVRLQQNERVLAAARRALTKFKDRHGTFALKEEYSSKLKTIGELEKDLETSESKLAGLLDQYTNSHPKVVERLAERNRLRASLARLRAEGASLPGKEKQLDDLQLRVKVAEDNYEAVNRTLEEARIQEASQASEVRVVSRASPAIYPSKPIKVYYGAAGTAAGLLIGLSFVFFMELMRTRVRSVDDAERLGLRVLATIPSLPSKENA